ncbi:MAG: hypothetical protein ACOY9Y_10730 [Bacillota bacterium]
MFRTFPGYDNNQIFQVLDKNRDIVYQTIKLFETSGWEKLAIYNWDKVEFVQLGWPNSKGTPIYPEGYQKDRVQPIDLGQPVRPF